jgi:hypothetical protein
VKKLLAILAIALFAVFISGVAGRSVEASQSPGVQPGSEVAHYPGADNVTLTTECMNDGRVRLRISWTTYGFGAQFFDLSLQNNGFIFGTFVGLGPLPSNQNSFVWEGISPGLQHYIRVNTSTQFGWAPSQTYTFFSPNCQYYPPQPNPGQCGTYPYYFPCNPQPNPTPVGCSGTPTYSTYVPGNCAPAGACQQATIAIFPAPPAGCVWTQKGEGSSYAIGEPVVYCYYVNQPMWVHIVATLPGGGQIEVLPWIQDNGQGGCATYGGANDPFGNAFLIRTAAQPSGGRTGYLYGGVVSPGGLLDTTTFTVN